MYDFCTFVKDHPGAYIRGNTVYVFSVCFSCIGCGLIQAMYAFHNISSKSQITVKYFSKMMRYVQYIFDDTSALNAQRNLLFAAGCS